MDRREALRSVAFLMGGTIIGAQAFLTGCQETTEQKVDHFNSLFSEQDILLMDEVGETIIPTTDTPGAKATGIGAFMAMMVLDCYDEQQQKAFRNGLNTIRENFEQKFGHSFEDGKPEERESFLGKVAQEVWPYYRNRKEGDPDHYFRMLKELTLLGYFTSEIGSNQALRYIQTPGRYEGCIPYEKGGKAWAQA